ncbi:MAG: magnesium transporter CorA family protein [bacterium]
MQKPKNVKIIEAKDFEWVNIDRADLKGMDYLNQHFHFNELDLRDCPPPIQRPKLLERPNYLFVILLFPIYSRRKRTIETAEVDFFIGPNFLVTVHNGELELLNNFFQECQKFEGVRNKYLESNPANLIYELLNRLILYCFPMLNHIGMDIDNIERSIFDSQQKRMLSEILLIKQNIVSFRKSMQAHKNIIKKVIDEMPKHYRTDLLDPQFKSLVEYTKEIWDLLENYRETIDALQQTNESLISFRLNQIMKTLTIFSVIVFPLTLLSSIFGMNTPGIPWMNDSYGFWKVVIIMFIGMIIMLIFFKKKKWL